MVQYKWFNTKLGPSEQIHHINLDRGPRTEEIIPIIVRVIILNQEVTVRVINLNHSDQCKVGGCQGGQTWHA